MRRFLSVPLVVTLGIATGCGSSRHEVSHPLLAYSSVVDVVLYDPATRARRTLVKGREPSEVTGDAGVLALDPAWSPDGSRVAYVRFGDATRIEVAEVATAKRWRVSHRVGDRVSGYGLRWSPDGRWLAYRDQDAGELWVTRTDGSHERLVVRARGLGGARLGILGWTREGRLVIRARGMRLAVRPDAGRPARYAGGFSPLTLSPDGHRRLVVARDAGGNDQIVVEALSGRLLGTLTGDRPIQGRLPVRSCCPRWSPDGRWVAFVRGGAVAVVGADGGHPRRVLEDAAIAGWSPDGRYLLVAGSLGERSLWLFEPGTGRRTLVARGYELAGAAWRPGRAPRAVTVAPPARVSLRTVETPLPTSSFRRGRVRIREIRPFEIPAGSRLADLSPDGRLAALSIAIGRHASRVAILDLATGELRRIGIAASPWWDDAPSFDRSGRRLLYRRWHELWSVSSIGGRRRLLVRDAGGGPFRLLRDGGLAYLDTGGVLVVRRADGTVRRRRSGLPAGARATLAIAPDGDRVLYAKGCDVWLENLRTGSVHRFAHARFSPTPASWSPTGAHVALAASRWTRATRTSTGTTPTPRCSTARAASSTACPGESSSGARTTASSSPPAGSREPR